MSIPAFPSDVRPFMAHVFSNKEFNNTYMKELKKFYKRDDNGNYRIIKSAKSFIRGLRTDKVKDEDKYGYDVMYEKILKLSKTLNDSSLNAFISGLKEIFKIMENYVKNKNEGKNKSKYVKNLKELLQCTIRYLEDWQKPLDLKKLTNRDIAAYIRSLNSHTNLREIGTLVKDFLNELAERSKDPIQKADIEKQLKETTVY